MNYKRNINSMGTGLIMISITATNSLTFGLNYIMFNNGRKPPLEIAVHNNSKCIQSIQFFLQDEDLKEIKEDIFVNKIIEDIDLFKGITENKENYFFANKDFDAVMYKNSIVLVEKNKEKQFSAYCLNEENWILLDNDLKFCGLWFKKISKNEILELEASNVI